MREYEFEKNVDVLRLSEYEMQIFLMQNPHIVLESAYDFKEFRNTIDQERPYTVELDTLIQGKIYFPMFLHALPVASYIKITIGNNLIFDKRGPKKLYFKTNDSRNITFPDDNREIGDMCTDTLIFNSLNEQQQFLSVLKMTYGTWTIESTKLN